MLSGTKFLPCTTSHNTNIYSGSNYTYYFFQYRFKAQVQSFFMSSFCTLHASWFCAFGVSTVCFLFSLFVLWLKIVRCLVKITIEPSVEVKLPVSLSV